MDNPLLQEILRFADGVFAGPNGDYPAVLEALAGVDAARAAWKPHPECNSIWQIANHIYDSKKWEIDMLEKGRAAPSAWIQPDGNGRAWQSELARLKDTHIRLKSILGKFNDGTLQTPKFEDGQTPLGLILSITAHEAFHAGQIDYLKGFYDRTVK
jgi:hypothetical protein